MPQFRVVNGVARFGQGQILELTPEQIAPRAHCLEVPADFKPRGRKPALVTATGPVEFKIGEVIGLAEVPNKVIAGVLEEVVATEPPSLV